MKNVRIFFKYLAVILMIITATSAFADKSCSRFKDDNCTTIKILNNSKDNFFLYDLVPENGAQLDKPPNRHLKAGGSLSFDVTEDYFTGIEGYLLLKSIKSDKEIEIKYHYDYDKLYSETGVVQNFADGKQFATQYVTVDKSLSTYPEKIKISFVNK